MTSVNKSLIILYDRTNSACFYSFGIKNESIGTILQRSSVLWDRNCIFLSPLRGCHSHPLLLPPPSPPSYAAAAVVDSSRSPPVVKDLCNLKEGDAVSRIPKQCCLTFKPSGASQLIEKGELGGNLQICVALMYEENRTIQNAFLERRGKFFEVATGMKDFVRNGMPITTFIPNPTAGTNFIFGMIIPKGITNPHFWD